MNKAIEQRLKALEGERDRQYEENVSLIAKIAALEAELAIRPGRPLTQKEKDERLSPPIEICILDEDMSL